MFFYTKLSTNQTHSTFSAIVNSNFSIFKVELMPVFTMRAFKKLCARAISAQYVFFQRNGFKMIGVNAQSIFTKVIQGHLFRNFSFIHRIRNSVSNSALTIEEKVSVASRLRSFPKPTVFCFFNFRQESFFGSSTHSVLISRNAGLINGF